MTGPVRVLIVDDDPLVRGGLTMMLGGTDAIAVVGEAGDGDEVLAAIARHRPEAQRRCSLARLALLSPRDREIAREVAAGKPNAAIAQELHLSVATVKSHVSAMLAELSLDNRVQIALMVQDAERP